MFCGTLATVTVSSSLECLFRASATTGMSVLVRSIDSERDRGMLDRILVKCGLPHTLEIPGWVVPGTAIPIMLERRLFNGFDEIWLFEGPAASLGTVPSEWAFTSDRGEMLQSQDIPAPLAALFAAHPNLLILADGCGLNYITSNEDWLSRIQQADRS